jgi:hypothetical protein
MIREASARKRQEPGARMTEVLQSFLTSLSKAGNIGERKSTEKAAVGSRGLSKSTTTILFSVSARENNTTWLELMLLPFGANDIEDAAVSPNHCMGSMNQRDEILGTSSNRTWRLFSKVG